MRILFVLLSSLFLLYAYEIKKLDSSINIDAKGKKVINTIFLSPKKTQDRLQFSYAINENAEILPILLSVKDKYYKVYLKDHQVFFTIFDVKEHETLQINITYKTLNNQKFLQIHPISLPKFSTSIHAKVQVEINRDWEVISHHPLFKQKGNVFILEDTHFSRALRDYFWLSIREAKWDIYVKNYVYSTQRINNIRLVIPKYFKDSNLDVKKNVLNANIKSAQMIQKVNHTSFVFHHARAQDFLVEMRSEVINRLGEKKYKNLDPKKFLPKKQMPNLAKLAQEIVQNNPHKPKHIAIGQWVFEHIKYNENFINKHLSTQEIIKAKNGVCEHYAQLYNDLLHAIGIPSVFVTGAGFNPTKKIFEYHAWNLVYVDDQWIPIDSTWGLFGGKLPVSHIFFYVGYQPLAMYETYDIPIDKTHIEVEQKIRYIH